MSKQNTLHSLLINKLRSILDMEIQIAENLPLMAESATEPDLKSAFEDHLAETEVQAERIERSLEILEEQEDILESETIRGMAEDTEWLIDNVNKGPALDASLIAAARAVEHYEIAEYTAAIEWAELMNHKEVKESLEKSLEEEKNAEKKLKGLAAKKINSQVELGM
jgi:ferritin-like metal-binding protein YciE